MKPLPLMVRHARATVGGRARILLVDPDLRVAGVLREMLTVLGYPVLHAAHADAALAACAAGLVDGVLAERGLQTRQDQLLIDRLRELCPTLPIAILTAWPLGQQVDLGGLGGPATVWPKPISLSQLARRMHHLLLPWPPPNPN